MDRENKTSGGVNNLSDILKDRQGFVREALWHSQDPVINLILGHGLEEYVIREEDELVREMFRTDIPTKWGCMDGRFSKRRIATAGPGVFWTPEQKEVVVDKVRAARVRVDGVYRHRDCGAEKTVIRELVDKEGLTKEQAEERVAQKVENFARKLGTEVRWYTTMKHSRFHYERALFLVGTEMFDITTTEGIYPFQLNVRFSPDIDAVLARINLAIDGIAFGPSGPGADKFKEAPFVICIIGDSTMPEYNFDSLNSHLQPLLANYGDLVTVRGFDVPEKFLRPAV